MELGISGSNSSFSRSMEETKNDGPGSQPLQQRGAGRAVARGRGGARSQPSNSSQPKRMTRASQWTPEVENAFRFQCAGWRSMEEYSTEYDDLQTWPMTEYGQFIKMLRVKKNGNFMYFRQSRECEDKHLSKVKIFEY